MSLSRKFQLIFSAFALSATVLVASAWRLGYGDPAGIPSRDLPPIKGEERAILTSAPSVPAPITRDYAT
jgi:hypothetical protein